MKQYVLIGGAWPYANNSLHLGHIAALLPGDIIARYYRKAGASVLYVSGTDCHGTPITIRAKEENKLPETIALSYHEEFIRCFKELGFSYNSYTLTHNSFHFDFVKFVVDRLYNYNELYKKAEYQDYCETCERFLSDREIRGICPNCGSISKGDQCDNCLSTFDSSELLNKTCQCCGSRVSQHKNVHLYWKLSKYQSTISRYIDEHKVAWRPSSVSESLKYLSNTGLVDRAITRQLDWGIDVPIKGFEDKRIYVWIDAVLGYISAGIKYCKDNGLDWENYYKNSTNLTTYFVHGKDNIPFHTIIYPALLNALRDDFQLPDHIVSSQFLNVDDEKISKSRGNGIAVKDLLKVYPSDSIRYCLTYQAPELKDTNYTEDILVQLHNKFLAGEYGNFINRNLSFIIKKFNGVIPDGEVDSNVVDRIKETYAKVGNLIENAELKNAIQEIQHLVKYSNKYYDKKQPWVQVKNDIKAFNDTTATCIALIVNLANLYEPFIPDSSKKVLNFFGISNANWEYLSIKNGLKLNEISILFSKIG